MKNVSDSKLEQRLNELYAELTYDQAIDQFIYLTNKDRVQHCGIKSIGTAYHSNKLGSLLRKYDPIAFYSSRSDF